ncbi:MAG: glycosyltransferase family 39 protein, partial [Lachnospiraceae bacterium]|nr:glycosyltransferase family 39 protein [Lachnospiraceae bacterium]
MNRIRESYGQHKTTVIMVAMFIVSVVVRTAFAGYEKHILVIPDELLYYSYAQNLAWGNGFPVVYHGIYNYENRFLYSILIAPAFLMHNRVVQFVLIAMINSIILTVGMIPTYLLAKELIDGKWGFFCVALYLTMPDMAYAATFMPDILMLSLGLWIIYVSYKLMDFGNLNSKQRIGYMAILTLLIFAGVWTKKS